MMENAYYLRIPMERYARLKQVVLMQHLLLSKNVNLQIQDAPQTKLNALNWLIAQPINLRRVVCKIRQERVIQLQANVIGMMLLQLVMMKPALKLPQEQ